MTLRPKKKPKTTQKRATTVVLTPEEHLWLARFNYHLVQALDVLAEIARIRYRKVRKSPKALGRRGHV